jgi:hypothetical protein
MHAKNTKGVALPIETIVILVLAAIVLGALLAFFLGIFTPGTAQTNIVQKQLDLCRQYVRYDSYCNAIEDVGDDIGKAGDIYRNITDQLCGKPTNSPICRCEKTQSENVKECCPMFCPK